MQRFPAMRFSAAVQAAVLALMLQGCFLKKRVPQDADISQAIQKPLSPEQTKGLLSEAAGNWFYGQGVGNTMVQAGTIVAFPPYALLVLGNAALTVSGYEPLRFGDILPEDGRKQWNSFYDGLTSGPGRLNAAVAGREFITREHARGRLAKYLPKEQGEPPAKPQP